MSSTYTLWPGPISTLISSAFGQTLFDRHSRAEAHRIFGLSTTRAMAFGSMTCGWSGFLATPALLTSSTTQPFAVRLTWYWMGSPETATGRASSASRWSRALETAAGRPVAGLVHGSNTSTPGYFARRAKNCGPMAVCWAGERSTLLPRFSAASSLAMSAPSNVMSPASRMTG